MSRFKNLELGGNSKEAARTEARDAGFYLAQAEKAVAEGDFEGALRFYDRALSDSPGDAACWSGQVRMLIELKEYAEAKRLADKALEVLANHPQLLAARAVALARENQIEPALAFSDAAIESGPNDFYAWLARGDVLLAARIAQAEYCFRRAAEASPGNWLVLWMAARIHIVHEKFTLALKYAQQALALDSSRSVIWLEMGRCQQALALYAPAQDSFSHAVELNPQSTAAKLAQANLAANQGVFTRLSRLTRRLFRP
jgi:tetratricopeptide (TPR) repeat protein